MPGTHRGIVVLAVSVGMCVVAMSAASQRVDVATSGASSARGSDQIEQGRRAVGQACAPCHSNILRIVQIHRKSAEEWRDTVYSMIGRGAQILPEEIEPLTAFLAAASAGQSSTSGPARTPSTDSPAAASVPGPPLPEGEGRSVLQRQCVRCHDLASAIRKPASDDWKTVIARMLTYGADVSPSDQQKLIDYLNGLAKPSRP
jgi:cytochrome c5